MQVKFAIAARFLSNIRGKKIAVRRPEKSVALSFLWTVFLISKTQFHFRLKIADKCRAEMDMSAAIRGHDIF